MPPEWLRDLDRSLAADLGSEGLATAVVLLAAIAGEEVPIAEEEAHGACRRALVLLAAGGDPARGLDLEGRAVSAVADDLDAPERRAALTQALERLRGEAAGLPYVSEAVHGLLDAPDVAWRSYACSLLAETLAAED
jgi:hypothetical protein